LNISKKLVLMPSLRQTPIFNDIFNLIESCELGVLDTNLTNFEKNNRLTSFFKVIVINNNMTEEKPPQKFLNTRTVSYVLGISESSVKRLRSTGKGPAWHTFGSSVRYCIDDLKTYIEGSRNNTD